MSRVTLKRGGRRGILSLDAEVAEDLYAREPAEQAPDDRFFDRRWALALVGQVRGRLQKEYLEVGKARRLGGESPCCSEGESAPHDTSAILGVA